MTTANKTYTPHDTLTDSYGRTIRYLRLSVTDRCNFRCMYCMPDKVRFVPRDHILDFEEIIRTARLFVGFGVTKLRITGGEPLIRRDIVALFRALGRIDGVRELAVTTNGTHLDTLAMQLRDAGVTTVNISLDTLRAERFTAMTRKDRLPAVLAGIDAACAARFTRIRINSVILRGINDDEVLDLIDFAVAQQCDIAFIEEMPLGENPLYDRAAAQMASDDIVRIAQTRHTLVPLSLSTGGPARYHRIAGTNSRLGCISPNSHNFCESCNRLRLTAAGRLLLCLGNEHSLDLRTLLRNGSSDATIADAIEHAIQNKPERHHFSLHDLPTITRTMNATGG